MTTEARPEGDIRGWLAQKAARGVIDPNSVASGPGGSVFARMMNVRAEPKIRIYDQLDGSSMLVTEEAWLNTYRWKRRSQKAVRRINSGGTAVVEIEGRGELMFGLNPPASVGATGQVAPAGSPKRNRRRRRRRGRRGRGR